MILALLLAAAPPVPTAVAPPPPQAVDDAHIAKARALVTIVLPPETRDKMFAAVLDGMIGTMMAGAMQADPTIGEALEEIPELKPAFGRFIERQRSLVLGDLKRNTPALVEAYAHAYARQFNDSELNELTRFFATPAGAKYVARSGALVTDPDIGAWMRQAMAEQQARKDDELKKFLDEVAPIIAAHEKETRHAS